MTNEGKALFYPKVFEALSANGFDVMTNVQGKGRQHASKPDYIAIKGRQIVIREIKSPSEGPLSNSWRVPQISDTKEFTVVRLDVASREKQGLISREQGGHEIIIRGQIPDYRRKLGTTYDLPIPFVGKGGFAGGYSAPFSESKNIEEAFSNCSIANFEKISRNGTVTFIFLI